MSAELHHKSYRVLGARLYVVVDPHALGDLGAQSYGAVVASSFRDDAAVRSPRPDSIRNVRHIEVVDDAIDAYRDGVLDALDQISVTQPGGPFQQRVWAKMRLIPPGSVATYAQLARKAGSGNAYRAAGTACSTNNLAPFVPCHRVVSSAGLGGYGYGLDLKVALLEHEGALM